MTSSVKFTAVYGLNPGIAQISVRPYSNNKYWLHFDNTFNFDKFTRNFSGVFLEEKISCNPYWIYCPKVVQALLIR